MTHYAPRDYDNHPPVSIGDWIVTILVMMIPVVNIVMMFVWAFSGGTNPSKANFFKAQLLFVLIAVVLMVLLAFLGVLAGGR